MEKVRPKTTSKPQTLRKLFKMCTSATQFELGFRFAALYLLLPLFSFLVRQTYKLAGFSYIRSDNLSALLKNPLVLAYLLLLLLFFGCVVIYEITVLIHLTSPSQDSSGLGIRKLSLLAVRQNWQVLRRHPLGYTLLVLLFVPLFGSLLASPLLPELKIPGFIMAAIFQSKLYTFIYVLANALIWLLAIALSFTFHGLFLEKLTLQQALQNSLLLFRRHFIKILWRMLWVSVLLIVCFLLIALLLMIILGLIVVSQIEHSTRLLILLTFSASLKSLGLWFFSAFSTAFFIAIINQLYFQLRADSALALSAFKPATQRKKLSRKWFTLVSLVVIAVLAFEGLRIYFTLDSDSDWLETPALATTRQITAHRGDTSTAPENTLAAVHGAMTKLADFVEIDVQLSRDGQVVLFHDSTLKRLTGDGRRLTDCTYAELQALRFLPAWAKEQPDERIPLLSEVLKLGKGKIRFNIELKPSASDAAALAQATARVIKEAGMQDKVIVASLNLNALKELKKVAPELKTMYILPFVQGDFSAIAEVDHYSIEESFITAALVARLQAAGHQVHVWTVNEPEMITKLADLQVNNLITDDPVLVRETLARNTPQQRLEAQVFDWLMPVIEILIPSQ